MKRVSVFMVIALFALTAQAKPIFRSLPEMIFAGGYRWVHADINSQNFPVKPSRFSTKRIEIVSLGEESFGETVLLKIQLRGLRPATIEELLAFGAENANRRLGRYTIAALGTSWTSPFTGPVVPCLHDEDGFRKLDLHAHYNSYVWGPDTLFLAVRK